MRLAGLALRDFKGCDVRLRWERVNVLFGPNDAGKTNLLEALATAFGSPDLARPSHRGRKRTLKVSAMFELEEDGGDEELLAALLQRAHVPPIFPGTKEDLGDQSAKQAVSPVRLRWAGRAAGARSFTLWRPQPDAISVGGAEPLDSARQLLKERGLRAMRERVRSERARADAEILLEAALASRWLGFEGGIVTLLCPEADECDRRVVAIAERVARRGWRADPVLGPFVMQLIDRPVKRQGLLRMLDRRALRPFDIVWIAAAGKTRDELELELRREFDRWFEENQKLADTARGLLRLIKGTSIDDDLLRDVIEDARTYTSPTHPWLGRFPDPHSASIAGWVRELADRVSDNANRLAAPVVREAGELKLSVLGPHHWIGEERRFEPTMNQNHRDEPTPIRDLGLGIGTWSAVAMLEAAAAQRAELLPQLDQLHQRLVGSYSRLRGFGSRRRLLIVDEPEQHLHPRAQREIAAWLAAGAEERETLLATHAIPFLDMPTERASYALVTREPDGVTNAVDISGDMFESLERMSVEAGLSGPAEALQTIRLIALVEGYHDEMVLRHFYHEALARYRVLVVAVRGAQNVNTIIDAPWLSRLGAPFVVLFDDVRAPIVEGRKRPSGRDIAARAVWDLLHHWDGPSPPPYVASFELPDIFRALPEGCVQRAVQLAGGSFPGWKEVDAAFDRARETGFKKILLARSGLTKETDLDALLASALERCRTKPHPALQDAVGFVIAHARLAGAPAFDRAK